MQETKSSYPLSLSLSASVSYCVYLSLFVSIYLSLCLCLRRSLCIKCVSLFLFSRSLSLSLSFSPILFLSIDDEANVNSGSSIPLMPLLHPSQSPTPTDKAPPPLTGTPPIISTPDVLSVHFQRSQTRIDSRAFLLHPFGSCIPAFYLFPSILSSFPQSSPTSTPPFSFTHCFCLSSLLYSFLSIYSSFP